MQPDVEISTVYKFIGDSFPLRSTLSIYLVNLETILDRILYIGSDSNILTLYILVKFSSLFAMLTFGLR